MFSKLQYVFLYRNRWRILHTGIVCSSNFIGAVLVVELAIE